MADLQFASQAEADRYAIERQIKMLKPTSVRRVMRSNAGHGQVMERLERLERSRDALSAPIYKLTDDILREIFAVFALGGEYANVNRSLTLSHVVSRWRRVSLEMPALWTSLDFDLSGYQPYRQAWQALFPLSRSLPVRIRVTHAHSVRTRARASPSSILDTSPASLQEIVSKCQVLQIVGKGVYLPVRTNWLATGMPLLTDLTLKRQTVDFFDFWEVLSSLPALRLLVLDELAIDRPSTPAIMIVTPLRSLKILYIKACGHYPYVMWRKLLAPSTTPSLRNLQLEVDFLFDSTILRRDFSTVVSFTLFVTSYADDSAVRNTICSLPALEELALDAKIHKSQDGLALSGLMPPLSSIDFLSSTNIDALARLLVEATTTERPSLKLVRFSSSDVSAETRQWISERVSVDTAE